MNFRRSAIPLPDDARTDLLTALGDALVGVLVLRQGLELAHWNVHGHAFIKLHHLFDEGREMVAPQLDRIAERIRTLGALVGTNIERLGDTSKVADYPVRPLDPWEHVAELADRFDAYLGLLQAAGDVAVRLGELGTQELLSGIIDETQVYAWKLLEHLEPEGALPTDTAVVP